MSDGEEGRKFSGVQDRLKLFEQTTTKTAYVEPLRSNQKSFPSSMKVPVTNISNLTNPIKSQTLIKNKNNAAIPSPPPRAAQSPDLQKFKAVPPASNIATGIIPPATPARKDFSPLPQIATSQLQKYNNTEIKSTKPVSTTCYPPPPPRLADNTIDKTKDQDLTHSLGIREYSTPPQITPGQLPKCQTTGHSNVQPLQMTSYPPPPPRLENHSNAIIKEPNVPKTLPVTSLSFITPTSTNSSTRTDKCQSESIFPRTEASNIKSSTSTRIPENVIDKSKQPYQPSTNSSSTVKTAVTTSTDTSTRTDKGPSLSIFPHTETPNIKSSTLTRIPENVIDKSKQPYQPFTSPSSTVNTSTATSTNTDAGTAKCQLTYTFPQTTNSNTISSIPTSNSTITDSTNPTDCIAQMASTIESQMNSAFKLAGTKNIQLCISKEEDSNKEISSIEDKNTKSSNPTVQHNFPNNFQDKVITDTKPSDSPPSVPPPPATITKLKSTALVGWALATQKLQAEPEKCEEGVIASKPEKRTLRNINDTNKRPPVLVPPPSMTIYDKARTIAKETVTKTQEDDTLYDEDEEDLTKHPWYFEISKNEASKIMSESTEIGTFMVRPSENNQYVLMVREKDDVVKKFKIQSHSNGWIFGELTKSKTVYPTIPKLMEFNCANGLKIGNKILKLKEPPSK